MKALVQEEEATQKQSPAPQHQIVSAISNLQVDKGTKEEVRFQETSERCQLCDKDGHTAKQCPATHSKERKDVSQTFRHDVRHQHQVRGRWNR